MKRDIFYKQGEVEMTDFRGEIEQSGRLAESGITSQVDTNTNTAHFTETSLINKKLKKLNDVVESKEFVPDMTELSEIFKQVGGFTEDDFSDTSEFSTTITESIDSKTTSNKNSSSIFPLNMSNTKSIDSTFFNSLPQNTFSQTNSLSKTNNSSYSKTYKLSSSHSNKNNKNYTESALVNIDVDTVIDDSSNQSSSNQSSSPTNSDINSSHISSQISASSSNRKRKIYKLSSSSSKYHK